MSHRCPICEKEFSPENSTSLPFCSKRCRQVDLDRWLGERYGLAIEREDGDREPPMDTDEHRYDS
jgi:endogenous inhibitor of DNA gyrase (YacG/DUF329 family)